MVAGEDELRSKRVTGFLLGGLDHHDYCLLTVRYV